MAIHNGFAYNRLFLRSLSMYTEGPFELIVVDNGSTDGSQELFLSAGARVVVNDGNFCYSCSMNQGMSVATGRLLCFANNDIWFGCSWDIPLREAIEDGGEWVVCPAGVEAAESVRARKMLKRRWNACGLLLRAFGAREFVLMLSLAMMYGDWRRFCDARRSRLRGIVAHGIQGNCVVARRELFEETGPWDTRIAAADWNLYLTVARRAEEKGDMKRPRVIADSYVHHFIRGTVRSSYPPFECGHGGGEVSDLWTQTEQERFGWQRLQEVQEHSR